MEVVGVERRLVGVGTWVSGWVCKVKREANRVGEVWVGH